MAQPRRPKGTSRGGQFTGHVRQEATTVLGPKVWQGMYLNDADDMV